MKKDAKKLKEDLVLSDEFSANQLDDALWSGAKDRWDEYTDEQKEYLMDYFASYAYDLDETPTLTSFNDFVWFEGDDILKENGMLFETVEEEYYTIEKVDDNYVLTFSQDFIDAVYSMEEDFDDLVDEDGNPITDYYTDFEDYFDDMMGDSSIDFTSFDSGVDFDSDIYSGDEVIDIANNINFDGFFGDYTVRASESVSRRRTIKEGASNVDTLYKIVYNIDINSPEYRGAPMPSFDKMKVNVSKFADELHPKSYDFGVSQDDGKEYIKVDWISQLSPINDGDLQALYNEIVRAVKKNLAVGGYNDPIDISIHYTDRDDTYEDYYDFTIDDDLAESCKKSKSLKEEIASEVYDWADTIADEIREKGFMNFTEIEERIAELSGKDFDTIYDEELDKDIFGLLNLNGINNNWTDGDFFTDDYAEAHPEVLEENKKPEEKIVKEEITLTDVSNPLWYGIPEIGFIWHGDRADPEIEYKGLIFNAYDVEDYMYTGYEDSGLEGTISFEDYMRENEDTVKGAITLVAPVGVADWVLDNLDFYSTIDGTYDLKDVREKIDYLRKETIIPDKILDNVYSTFENTVNDYKREGYSIQDALNDATPKAQVVLQEECEDASNFSI